MRREGILIDLTSTIDAKLFKVDIQAQIVKAVLSVKYFEAYKRLFKFHSARAAALQELQYVQRLQSKLARFVNLDEASTSAFIHSLNSSADGPRVEIKLELTFGVTVIGPDSGFLWVHFPERAPAVIFEGANTQALVKQVEAAVSMYSIMSHVRLIRYFVYKTPADVQSAEERDEWVADLGDPQDSTRFEVIIPDPQYAAGMQCEDEEGKARPTDDEGNVTAPVWLMFEQCPGGRLKLVVPHTRGSMMWRDRVVRAHVCDLAVRITEFDKPKEIAVAMALAEQKQIVVDLQHQVQTRAASLLKGGWQKLARNARVLTEWDPETQLLLQTIGVSSGKSVRNRKG